MVTAGRLQTLHLNGNEDKAIQRETSPEKNSQTDSKFTPVEQNVPPHVRAFNDVTTVETDTLPEFVSEELYSPRMQQIKFGRLDSETNEYNAEGFKKCDPHTYDILPYAVCQVEYKYRDKCGKQRANHGSGFLGIYNKHHGLFTNNHVLNEFWLNNLDEVTLKFDILDVEFEEHKINIARCFWFTCPLLDATYIKFSDDHSVFKSKLIKFLDLEGLVAPCPDEEESIAVIQRPSGSACTMISKGIFKEKFGFDFKHEASTDEGSSGSLVITYNNKAAKLIGIHKSASKISAHNTAVSLQAVLNSLNLHIESLTSCNICNPKFKDCKEKLDIPGSELSLSKTCIIKEDWSSYQYSSVKFVKDKNSVTFKLMMFVPTSHGWYWTPTDVYLENHPQNWMEVTQLKIVGGIYHDYKVEDKAIHAMMQCLPAVGCWRLYTSNLCACAIILYACIYLSKHM